MQSIVSGIHHITAIASDPQQTCDFYTQVLSLRLVKKSVNQDDLGTYHLFFGDTTGEPGMDLTFFTFMPVIKGRRGSGQVTKISLAVPENSLEYWQDRFDEKKIEHSGIVNLFGTKRLEFFDPDNQRLELVEVSTKIPKSIWTTNNTSADVAIQSFYGAELTVSDLSHIIPVLTILGYHQTDNNKLNQFALPIGDRAIYLEINIDSSSDTGILASGTVHHIAFTVKDEVEQLALRSKLIHSGLYPTEIIDRYYFKSVYFRIPAGILFELATLGPGFTVDEPVKELGSKLALPPFLESQRNKIESNLTPITVKKST